MKRRSVTNRSRRRLPPVRRRKAMMPKHPHPQQPQRRRRRRHADPALVPNVNRNSRRVVVARRRTCHVSVVPLTAEISRIGHLTRLHVTCHVLPGRLLASALVLNRQKVRMFLPRLIRECLLLARRNLFSKAMVFFGRPPRGRNPILGGLLTATVLT